MMSLGDVMKTKVMLINPLLAKDQTNELNSCFPMGLLYLASVMKKNNINVKIIDIDNYYENHKEKFDENEFIKNNLTEQISDFSPDIIGIGCLFSGSFGSLKRIAKNIKHIYPNTPIVIGGIHPTMFARQILDVYNFIDYIILGEGEKTFLELIENIINTKLSLEEIDGIVFRQNSVVILNPKTEYISNIDTLPFVDYSIIDINDYKMDTSNWYSPKNIEIKQPFPIISSRSCPQRCTFCSMQLVHGSKIRYRSSGNVLDEMGREMVNRINTASVKMDEMINDLLVHSKISQKDIRATNVNLEKYIKEAIEAFQGKYGLQVTGESDENTRSKLLEIHGC